MKKPKHHQPEGHELLRQSAVESDHRFWSGEGPVSKLQWVGLMLMLIAIAPILAAWIRNRYLIALVVVGGLALFVISGNRRARRKGREGQ
jgi:hypothetical protein